MIVGGYAVRWDWDAAQGLFLRSQLGSTHELTDGQVSTNNVVVLVVPYGTSPFGGPEAQTDRHRRRRRVQQRPQDRGHVDARQSPEDPWTLEAGGQPILLAPGRTWVELVDERNAHRRLTPVPTSGRSVSGLQRSPQIVEAGWREPPAERRVGVGTLVS